MSVVRLRCLDFDAWGGILGDTLLGQALEWREYVGASFDGISWTDYVRIGVADISIGIWIVESGFVRVDRPCCNVDLGKDHIRSSSECIG